MHFEAVVLFVKYFTYPIDIKKYTSNLYLLLVECLVLRGESGNQCWERGLPRRVGHHFSKDLAIVDPTLSSFWINRH